MIRNVKHITRTRDKNKIYISLPIDIKLTILKIKSKKMALAVLYDEKNYFSILIKCKNILRYDEETHCLVIRNHSNDSKIFANNYVSKFLKALKLYFNKKILFKGKSFRIKVLKKSKLIKFFFGKSHITFFRLKNIKLKRITKYKILIRNLNLPSLMRVGGGIINIRPVDLYTLRGLRISRSVITKRKGRKSPNLLIY